MQEGSRECPNRSVTHAWKATLEHKQTTSGLPRETNSCPCLKFNVLSLLPRCSPATDSRFLSSALRRIMPSPHKQFIIFPGDLSKSRVLVNSVKCICSFTSLYFGLYGEPVDPVSVCGSPNNLQINHFYHRGTHCEGYVIEQKQETIYTSFHSFRQWQQDVLTVFPMKQNVGFLICNMIRIFNRARYRNPLLTKYVCLRDVNCDSNLGYSTARNAWFVQVVRIARVMTLW
jgi:hypothetical protein